LQSSSGADNPRYAADSLIPTYVLPATSSKERVDFKLAFLIFRCLRGLATRYLSNDIHRVADTNRRRLHAFGVVGNTVRVRPTRLVPMGDRDFPVAGSRLWNNLPHEVTCAPTPPVFSSLHSVSTFVPFRLETLFTPGLQWFSSSWTLGHCN